jgi:hypothetical protein
MIITLKPHTPGTPGQQASHGNCSYVLSDQACEYFWEGSEALSIKTFSGGQTGFHGKVKTTQLDSDRM